MDKANVLKAMELCADPTQYVNGCVGCPYEGTEECDKHLLEDAIALLKESEIPKEKRYPMVYIFTKRTNLTKYITNKVEYNMPAGAGQKMRDYYAHERDIQLIAMFRWENGKCFCKIRCPINPIPVKGEFETPGTTTPVLDFLKENGWEFKQKYYPKMFE